MRNAMTTVTMMAAAGPLPISVHLLNYSKASALFKGSASSQGLGLAVKDQRNQAMLKPIATPTKMPSVSNFISSLESPTRFGAAAGLIAAPPSRDFRQTAHRLTSLRPFINVCAIERFQPQSEQWFLDR